MEILEILEIWFWILGRVDVETCANSVVFFRFPLFLSFWFFWNQNQRRCRVVNNNVSCGPACCTMWFPEAKTAAVPHLLALSCWMKQRRRYPRIGSVVCMPWPKRTASPWCPLRTAKQSNSTMTM